VKENSGAFECNLLITEHWRYISKPYIDTIIITRKWRNSRTLSIATTEIGVKKEGYYTGCFFLKELVPSLTAGICARINPFHTLSPVSISMLLVNTFESYRCKCTSIAPERRILSMYIYIAKLKIVSKFGDAIYFLLDYADM